MKEPIIENEKIWNEFCVKIKEKLGEITAPVIPSNSNRSYETLCDVVTNVILLEINIDKEPWDKIPKREVKFPKREEFAKEMINTMTAKKVCLILKEKISQRVSYNDRNAEDMDTALVATMNLYGAIENFISNGNDY